MNRVERLRKTRSKPSLDNLAADELGAVLAEAGERIVDVVDGEHHAQVAESVHRSVVR